MDKWTIILRRIPLIREGDVESMRLGDRLYEVAGIMLNNTGLRCRAATLVMEAGAATELHLVILPRDLEIITEDQNEPD